MSAAGLTSAQARDRLAESGPNTMPDTTVHPLRMAIQKLWAPVPWMLEAAMLLELVLAKYTEAGMIGGLVLFELYTIRGHRRRQRVLDRNRISRPSLAR